MKKIEEALKLLKRTLMRKDSLMEDIETLVNAENELAGLKVNLKSIEFCYGEYHLCPVCLGTEPGATNREENGLLDGHQESCWLHQSVKG